MNELSKWFAASPEWMAEGNCVGTPDPDVFFPATEGDLCIPLAKAICHGCPVLKECRDYALKNYTQGVWGGTTEAERRTIRALPRS